jgi:SAM-dependent methyltransferase
LEDNIIGIKGGSSRPLFIRLLISLDSFWKHAITKLISKNELVICLELLEHPDASELTSCKGCCPYPGQLNRMKRPGAPLNQRTCPWWLCPTFDNPLRQLIHPPQRILCDLILPGCQAIDLGCGMGYFSIPMAQMAGVDGRIYAADVQPKMLQGVQRRVRKAGLEGQIQTLLCQPGQLGLPENLDFALAFWMLHEVPDQAAFLAQVVQALKPGGRFLLVEPRLHVSTRAFERACQIAIGQGLAALGARPVAFSWAVLFEKR